MQVSFMSKKENWMRGRYRVVGPRIKTQNDVVKPKTWPQTNIGAAKWGLSSFYPF